MRMPSALRLAVLSLALSSLAACGHGDLTAAEFPAVYAQAYSAPVSRCRHQAGYLAQQDLADTRDNFAIDLPKAIKLGRAAFDSKQAQACIAALTGRGCGRVTETPASCWNAVRGLVPDGGACGWLLECTHGFCSGDNGCPATCIGALTAGAECPNKTSNAQCDARLGVECISSVCSPPLAAGGACDETSRCAAGLFCDSFDSKCAPQHNEQVVCGTDEECVDGLYCQLTSGGGLCRKKVAQGKPCGEDQDHAIAAENECQDGLLCLGFARKPPRPGICGVPGDVGSSCAASAQVPGCAQGLNCSGGLCTLPPGPGQTCLNGACLDGTAYCDASGQCQALLADGAACTQDQQCQGRHCDSGGTGKCMTPARLHACHEP